MIAGRAAIKGTRSAVGAVSVSGDGEALDRPHAAVTQSTRAIATE
jgi:hypothetical protein